MKISAQDLACARGGQRVLEHVSFSLAPGDLLILRGPNGAGKTTLLRCIAGLTPPEAGTLEIDPDEVAYAAHADGLKDQLSAAENLQFWAQIYGTRDIAPAIDSFDLAQLLERRTQDLSAGQRRRLSLARLTLTGRALWALDEPTVSLDHENVARFARAVSSHLAAGGNAIIATHIDLGLPEAKSLDLGPFRAKPEPGTDPFLDTAPL